MLQCAPTPSNVGEVQREAARTAAGDPLVNLNSGDAGRNGRTALSAVARRAALNRTSSAQNVGAGLDGRYEAGTQLPKRSRLLR